MTKKKVWKMPTEVYSRVVGYLRPVSSWNKGKQQEMRERVNYRQPILEVPRIDGVAIDNELSCGILE